MAKNVKKLPQISSKCAQDFNVGSVHDPPLLQPIPHHYVHYLAVTYSLGYHFLSKLIIIHFASHFIL